MATLGRIWGWLTPYRQPMALALVLTTLAALGNLPVPLLVQELIDQVVSQGRWGALPLYALLLLAVFVAQAVLALCNGLLIGRIGQGVVRDLRHRLYDHLQRLSLAYYDKTPSGTILSRVMDDVGAIQVFVTGAGLAPVVAGGRGPGDRSPLCSQPSLLLLPVTQTLRPDSQPGRGGFRPPFGTDLGGEGGAVVRAGGAGAGRARRADRPASFQATAVATQVSVERLSEIFDEPEPIGDRPGARLLLKPKGTLEFRDVRDWKLADLRQAVALVTQQAMLFEGRVRSADPTG